MRKVIFGICMIASACVVSEADEELPVVNLDEAETREVNLSELIDDVRIIPLETSEQYLISNPQIWFANNFILVSTSQPGSRLFRFDLNGKFINEIGTGSLGKGPGEHIGPASNIRYYEDDQLIQVNWAGKGWDPQLFNLAGNFVRDVHVPYASERGLDFIERWNDSVWFGSPFRIVGHNLEGDTSLIHFFTTDGGIVSNIPRRIFSRSESRIALPPAPVRYQKNDKWKFFVTGMDTLFRIEDMHLIPEVVFESKNSLDYNTITSQEELEGKLLIKSIAEGSNYWLLLRTIAHPLASNKPEYEVPLTLIDKTSSQAINIRLTDDVFLLLNETFFGKKWLPYRDGKVPFQDNRMYMIVNADELVELLNNKTKNVNQKFQFELDKLENLKEEDNPVIFLFTLKDAIELE